MKFHSLRKSVLAGAFAFIAAAVLTSCGGGGAAQSTQGGATLAILPSTGSIYAGVPVTFTLVGGRAPYTLASSEPSLLPVPTTVNGSSFTTVANNPGVVDPNQDPLLVPSRAVTIQIRDSGTSNISIGQYNVLQNFLTGYGVRLTPTACAGPLPTVTDTAVLSVPAGCEVGVLFNATTAGNLGGDRRFRISVIRGPYVLIDTQTGLTGNTLEVMSDHQGRITAAIRTLTGVSTQLAVIRVTELTTGVYSDTIFTITGGTSTTTLHAIPDAISFTGPDTATCGTGEVDIFVFDGTPPYSAASSNPNVVVFPINANQNPGVFRVRAVNSGVCLTNATIIFTDRFGARTTATVSTSAGSAAPPAPPPTPVGTTPTAVTLGCAQSGSVSITGGVPPYFGSSSNPNVTVTITGNTATITRAGPAGPGSVAQTTSAVNITDGTTVAQVSVTSPTSCP